MTPMSEQAALYMAKFLSIRAGHPCLSLDIASREQQCHCRSVAVPAERARRYGRVKSTLFHPRRIPSQSGQERRMESRRVSGRRADALWCLPYTEEHRRR